MPKKSRQTPQEKNKHEKEEKLSPRHRLKIEVAAELGLLDKVREKGWSSLSAAESGRIGGIMTKRLRQEGIETRN
ncbi:small, acid-soluble spore protein, alpha/beta type [Calderihabitans maritimus]|uniref:Small acid-soluble spore protein alpha/beta type n=1 Tax=Calderihabitans maritimus TaxID=1246530 RepID=A0A1Z5HP44_9FIRM|nr:small, acid-soluble spore protein, alpha/beta type [Calderihabitans maritimus]GAW91284.1 small acid-soluble spore protein alpha/beta type [Calderihabitans maritimus]